MLRRGRGRPRKHACSDGVLKSSQTALHSVGKALHRKQLKLRRHRILELANTNFCSTISKPRRSLRDLKHFARQLGKGAVPSLYPFCQQRASGVLADHRVGSQCSLGHVDWNSSGSRDFAPRTAILGSTLRSRENEDSDFVHDAHVDQWVGVEVILCGRKSSIGEVGSTTSNVCDELRSVVVDPEREQFCASFSKNLNPAPNGVPTQRTIIANGGENDEGRKAKHGVVPSWLNFRRNMTRKRRINTSGGISDCHISALIASLPKWSHIGTKVTSPKIIASTEEIGLQPCADQVAVHSVDNSCAAVISVDQSSEVIIPVEQPFASQESNVNSGQGSSLDFGQERQVSTCVLQSDAIQVCPTTPEKAQKRRRNYQDTISEHDVRGMDSFEPSNDGVPTVSNFPPKTVGGISENSLSADDNSGKYANDGLALMGDVILSSHSVEFESSCNSSGIGELSLNVGGVEVPGSLVNSVPTPAMTNPFDSISHVASVISDVIMDAVRESSQLFQTQVRTTTVFDTDSNGRKEERVTFKLNKNVGGTAIAPKIRKKYKPRVAKDKPLYKRYGSGLQNKTDGHTLDHGASKHGRTEAVHHQIIRSGVRRGISARDSCTSQSYFCGDHTNHTGKIGESRSSFFQEATAGPRAGELASTPVISTSPDRLPPSANNGCRTRNVLEEDELSPHPHWSPNVEQDRVASHSLLCTSCGLERRVTSGRSEIVQSKQINNLTSSNEDRMVSDSIIRRQKQFEMLSNELSNRVLALLDLPSIGQPHSLYSTAGGFERSPSMQASDFVRCYAEAALRKYIDEDGFSSFSEDWTASQSGLGLNATDTFSAEMTTRDASSPERTALDASNEEAIDFDLFYKEHLSAGLEDTLIQSLNDELNEFDSAIADTCLRGSHVTEDQRGVQDLLCKPQYELEELGIGACQQPNLWPSSVRRSVKAQVVFPESMEDRTMSSFYASTSAGVNIMMLSRLNEFLEQSIQQNVQQSDLRNRNAEKELSMSAMSDCGQTEVPSTGSEQRLAEGFEDLGLSEDYSCEDEDLMIPRESGLYQLSSQFLNSNPDSNFATESVIVAAEFSSDLEDCSVYNATLNQACPRKEVCPAKTPFHLMTYVQLVAYLKIVLTNSSEMSPLQMLRHVQAHLPDKEKLEFKKLWPMILHPVNSEQLQKLADLAEIDLPPYMEVTQDKQMEGQDDGGNDDYHWAPCIEMIPDELRRRPGTGANDDNHLPPCMEAFQYQQIERWDEGATEDNHLAACKEIVQYSQIGRGYEKARRVNHWVPCMEVIQYQHTEQQIERRNVEAQEGNHLTDLVPYAGNAIVAYDGSVFPLRKRKPRPKVDLDIETIRVWKLLMGKTETLEDDPDIDNELKWKQERIIMQEKVENFIRRMHLIQGVKWDDGTGDRSFSRWKGSVVDSVVGVFLTQNVSDVLSSSAFMCLRARFPSRRSRRPLQIEPPDKGIGYILQNDVHINLAPIQTLQEPQSSCFHGISSNCANEPREDIPASQESGHEKSDTSNPETRQVDILLPLGSESHGPLILGCQQEGIELYSQPEQPPATATSVNVSSIASELNICSITSRTCHGNSNASALEIMLEDTPFLSGSESQQPFTSFLEQGENMTHPNRCAGNSFELSTHSVTNAECSLTEEVMMSSIESQFKLLLLPPETNGANVAFTQELQNEEKLSTINVALAGLERAKMEADQVRTRKPCKWDALAEKYNARCQQAAIDLAPPRTEMTEDGVDWEAVRCADLEEIADAIKERGMNWKLAGRIKGLLERLRLEQGGIDLEWLRSIPSDDAKEFLSSVHGLGLKSVECIRLLALHHNAFPVDTNVGRICVRLGWVPLEPLPEELQLHVLELYPVQATIQKYLWPRLCTLDQQTLYELHYQLITFGKVFCTKSKPNCNACPMRSDCKHFASVLSSAKLALPASDSTSCRGATLALPPGSGSAAEVGEGPPQSAKTGQSSMCMSQYCQPIIEEPMTPESEADMTDCDIEDDPFSVEEVEVVSAIELYRPEIQGQQDMHQQNSPNRCCNLSTTLSELENVHEMDMADSETLAQEEAQPKVVRFGASGGQSLESAQVVVDCEGEGGGFNVLTRAAVLFSDAPSQEVVLLPPEAASIPVPKLKNIERLRTVHYVYELPDNHALLDGMDIREADDPCFYLLAIWSPDEVPESIPNINDDNEETSYTSFDFPRDEECIKATLLVPCRTAMQGSFPLNGTYFQVNEVFADHESSLQPMLVPRVLLWNLRRRFVYFGTSVTSILRGMTTEEIQACFSRGYVCVRGFDWTTRAPKPLVRRLHFQTTKSISRSSPTKSTKT